MVLRQLTIVLYCTNFVFRYAWYGCFSQQIPNSVGQPKHWQHGPLPDGFVSFSQTNFYLLVECKVICTRCHRNNDVCLLGMRWTKATLTIISSVWRRCITFLSLKSRLRQATATNLVASCHVTATPTRTCAGVLMTLAAESPGANWELWKLNVVSGDAWWQKRSHLNLTLSSISLFN